MRVSFLASFAVLVLRVRSFSVFMVLFFDGSFFCVIRALFPMDGSEKGFSPNFPTCVGVFHRRLHHGKAESKELR